MWPTECPDLPNLAHLPASFSQVWMTWGSRESWGRSRGGVWDQTAEGKGLMVLFASHFTCVSLGYQEVFPKISLC